MGYALRTDGVGSVSYCTSRFGANIGSFRSRGGEPIAILDCCFMVLRRDRTGISQPGRLSHPVGPALQTRRGEQVVADELKFLARSRTRAYVILPVKPENPPAASLPGGAK
jgi:hypothetical protein